MSHYSAVSSYVYCVSLPFRVKAPKLAHLLQASQARVTRTRFLEIRRLLAGLFRTSIWNIDQALVEELSDHLFPGEGLAFYISD